ncbi:negative regulator of genetic competence MecA [Halalkalibacter wakoensis JCM 9140]|uniref:Adapter protein MecA n=1 Tax=Halalkalibacter wakoensis JCM 9140 TaxID=1236970 RepID=W4Q158_9BACI|nr:genetic competence negative regulator [Halalkalibacter wakoensis]GAE25690.1 negative regulator of genetic competence MecA [Halalkalibacter wakoensis JCM 9140]
MRLERLNTDKFKAFLTFDDMRERGLTKEDLWQDLPKVHDLFRDMILEADDELGFKVDGPIAVEVYAMPAQGMVIIVSKNTPDEDFDEEGFEEGYIEMQVTLDETEDIFYEFNDIEDVIALSSRLYPFGVQGGSLYAYRDQYFIKFEEFDVDLVNQATFVSLLAEFGNPSTVSSYVVEEYGKRLIKYDSVAELYRTFVAK